MTNTRRNEEAENLIIEFLSKHPVPKTQDWKQFIEQFPQHAIAIANAAMIRAAGDAVEASCDATHDLDEGLANRTVSKVLSKIHQMTNLNLTRAQSVIASIQKPADRRSTAIEVGIGPYPSLINGILSGRTRAPSRVLDMLAAKFDVPRLALVEFFRRQFEASVVPAFKSVGSKPKLATKPAAWEDAVKGLKLSDEETERLLKLGSED